MSTPWDRRRRAEQRRVQDLLVARWVPEVADFAAFWAEHLASAGVKPGQVRSVARLREVPPLRELALRDAGGPGAPALVLRPTEEQIKARAGLSTLLRVARGARGPDGTRRALIEEFKPVQLFPSGRDGDLTIAATRSDLDRLHRAGARAASVLGLGVGHYLLSLVPAGPELRFWSVYHLSLGASMLAIHTGGDADPGTAEWVFPRVPVTAVAVAVDEAATAAATVRATGADLARVTTVVTWGPPPEGTERDAIRSAWREAGAAADVRVLALWCPSGGRAAWAECAASAADGDGEVGLHTYPDLEVVEVVDPAGNATSDAGDLTYTSAGWHGTAMIRYRTGDYVGGIAEDPCPACGRTVPRVLPPVLPGVWEPVTRTGRGERRIDLRGAAEVLDRASGVKSWRLELRGGTRRHPDDAYVVTVGGDVGGDGFGRLHTALEAAVGAAPLPLVVDDAEQIAAHVAEAGTPFEDRR